MAKSCTMKVTLSPFASIYSQCCIFIFRIFYQKVEIRCIKEKLTLDLYFLVTFLFCNWEKMKK